MGLFDSTEKTKREYTFTKPDGSTYSLDFSSTKTRPAKSGRVARQDGSQSTTGPRVAGSQSHYANYDNNSTYAHSSMYSPHAGRTRTPARVQRSHPTSANAYYEEEYDEVAILLAAVAAVAVIALVIGLVMAPVVTLCVAALVAAALIIALALDEGDTSSYTFG